jgi:hypothetical protein
MTAENQKTMFLNIPLTIKDESLFRAAQQHQGGRNDTDSLEIEYRPPEGPPEFTRAMTTFKMNSQGEIFCLITGKILTIAFNPPAEGWTKGDWALFFLSAVKARGIFEPPEKRIYYPKSVEPAVRTEKLLPISEPGQIILFEAYKKAIDAPMAKTVFIALLKLQDLEKAKQGEPIRILWRDIVNEIYPDGAGTVQIERLFQYLVFLRENTFLVEHWGEGKRLFTFKNYMQDLTLEFINSEGEIITNIESEKDTVKYRFGDKEKILPRLKYLNAIRIQWSDFIEKDLAAGITTTCPRGPDRWITENGKKKKIPGEKGARDRAGYGTWPADIIEDKRKVGKHAQELLTKLSEYIGKMEDSIAGEKLKELAGIGADDPKGRQKLKQALNQLIEIGALLPGTDTEPRTPTNRDRRIKPYYRVKRATKYRPRHRKERHAPPIQASSKKDKYRQGQLFKDVALSPAELAAWLKDKGLTYRAAGKILSTSIGNISKYIRGENSKLNADWTAIKRDRESSI